jgi:hypothetical protein
LIDLETGTVIHFSDSGWSNGAWRTGEGGATFTAPGDITAGTILFAGPASSNLAWNTLENYSALSDGATVGTGGLNLSASGDQVVAFQGDGAVPTFIYAAMANSTQFQTPADPDSTNTSELYPGLTVGLSAVAAGAGEGPTDEFDNIVYAGTLSGTPQQLRLAIGDNANWVGNNTVFEPPEGSLTIVPEPAAYAALMGIAALFYSLFRARRATPERE